MTSSLALWTAAAFGATLLGSSLLLWKREWAKLQVWRILAFASGALLSVAFLHLLPEASSLSSQRAGLGVLTAFFLLFSVEGFTMMHSCQEFAEDCHVHIVSWGAFSALSLHSLFDGVAIAVAFGQGANLGAAVASAILIHKFTDGLTLTGLLMNTTHSTRKCFLTVGLLALATPVGVLLAGPFVNLFSTSLMGYILGFIAGIFLYVGASDILPRVHKARDIYCWGSFALGLFLGALPH